MVDEAKAKGGRARAQALTPEQRKEIARQAALKRWDADTPQATHDGYVDIGGKQLFAAVLPDGRRVLSQGTFLKAIGRSRTPKAGTGALMAANQLPFFLSAEQLRSFIDEELRESSSPIFFRDKAGKKAVGYNANLLPKVCEVYLKLRDESLSKDSKVPARYAHIIKACDILTRGLAHVGIIALVDEATGFQEIRDRRALQEILDRFLAKELAAWAKCFPDEFYKQIFRLRKWQWRGMKINRPQVVAKYTNDIVYERLAPGILEELQKKNPKDTYGKRRAKHHQWLTEDVGHPALAQHLHGVIMLMRTCSSWDEFKKRLDIASPKRGQTIEFSF